MGLRIGQARNASQLLSFPVVDEGRALDEASADFHFAAAVACFGMLLRDSPYKGNANWQQVLDLATAGQGASSVSYREEFVLLVRRARALSER